MMSIEKLYERAKTEVENFDLDSLRNFGLDRTLDTYYLSDCPYPPLLAMQAPTSDLIQQIFINVIQPVDLYIHFPFCRVVGTYECTFCHFYKISYDREIEDKYIDACLVELKMYKQKLGQIRVRSIYFGGGTFSLISLSNLERLMSFLHEEFIIEKNAEIKFEIHADASKTPEILEGQLTILRKYRVTHICLDIQTLNEESLRAVTWGRLSPDDYFNTLNICKLAGFDKFVTGIIQGLPFESFESSIRNALLLCTIPEIITINNFQLKLKKGDFVYDQHRIAPEIFPNISERDVTNHGARILFDAFGFHESPIYFMNRGKTIPDHQTSKFEGNTQLGIGTSAFGLFYGNRIAQYYNVPNIKDYLTLISQNIFPIWQVGPISASGWARRRLIISGLNLKKPFNILEIAKDVRDETIPLIEFFCSLGMLEFNENFVLPTKKGLLRLQEMSYFFSEKYVREALRGTDRRDVRFRYNFFTRRTHEQENLFYEGYEKFRKGK